jgi:hypothetical protein
MDVVENKSIWDFAIKPFRARLESLGIHDGDSSGIQEQNP